MNSVFGNQTRTAVIALVLCALSFVPGCRPAPVPTSPSVIQESTPPASDMSAEDAKRSEKDSVSAPDAADKRIARLLPESLIGVPDKDLATRRLEYNTMVRARTSDTLHKAAWQYRITQQGKVVGFEFSNHGGNPILPPRRDAVKNQFFTRDFQFHFDERARQDIHLMVSDWVPSRDRVFRLSGILNSLMLFFPRVLLPAIVNDGERNIVTLPTGEDVEFNAATSEISGGVLTEIPVDLNPDRTARKFPGISYRGKGIVVRANSRGTDPRIAQTATITNGAQILCEGGVSCSECQVPSKELWDQSGAVRFKFSSDTEFDRFLLARCGFGLPRIGSEFAVLTAAQ